MKVINPKIIARITVELVEGDTKRSFTRYVSIV